MTLSTRLPVRPVYVITVLAGSFLLFLVQPLFGRVVLPVLGGSPNVWNVAMLFYQAILLLGYLYADRLQRLPVRGQLAVHLGLFAVAALSLPIGMAGWYPAAGAGNPSLWLIGLLAVSIGPVFFVVSAQAPLMQAWFARTGDADAANPYFLYAASNLGSFAALISYPFVVEPLAGLGLQRLAWSGGFVGLALLVGVCGMAAVRGAGGMAATTPEPVAISWPQKLRWMTLAGVASGLLLSTTTHLTTDLMAMPLLWVVPLAIYLLSFVIGFSSIGPAVTARATDFAPVMLLIVGGPMFLGGIGPAYSVALALAGLLLLLVLTVAIHGTLATERPAAGGLTSFYVWLSVGGAMGGLFCALLAPLLFSWPWEHPLLLLAAAWLFPGRIRSNLPQQRPVALAMVAIAILLSAGLVTDFGFAAFSPPAGDGLLLGFALAAMALLVWLAMGRRGLFVVQLALLMLALGGSARLAMAAAGQNQRSFFGVYAVTEPPGTQLKILTHGTTLHGVQSIIPALMREPMTYYVRGSGVGRAMIAAPLLFGAKARIGVVGLGTGTLACYRQPGQSWTIYEIDPVVEAIARTRFSYLSLCNPAAHVVIGDARLTLKAAPASSLDLLAVDAFASDAIPLHLMTREALMVYGRVLAKDGVLLVHISNRFLKLEPVLAALASDGGWRAMKLNYRPNGPDAPGTMNGASQWIAMSRDPARLAALKAQGGDWQALQPQPGLVVWSDDFASVLPVLRWRKD